MMSDVSGSKSEVHFRDYSFPQQNDSLLPDFLVDCESMLRLKSPIWGDEKRVAVHNEQLLYN